MIHTSSRMRGMVGAVWVISVLLFGCQIVERTPEREWNPLPIESFSSVAGNWAGVLVRTPKARRDDWVRLTIANDGEYVFESFRTIGVFSGRGHLSLTEGKLTVSSDRGSATGSWFASDGARMLLFVGMMKDGTVYTAELEPAK